METAFKCDLCSAKLDSLDKLNAHLERQHERVRNRKKTNFKCNLCDHEFSRGNNLKRHIRTRTCERPFKCQVSGCSRAFKRRSTLQDHVKFKHSDERSLQCDFPGCPHTAKTASNLEQHKIIHSDERPFACPHSECNYRAKRKANLSQHKACAHSESKTLSCSKCDYHTKIASNLARHIIVHEGKNKNIPCSIDGCEYTGRNIIALKEHMRQHKTHQACPVSGCGKFVTTQEVLKNHLKLHDSSGRAFQCPMCFKYYARLDDLQKHCVLHTNEKPFQCGHCEFATGRPADVKRHISLIHPSNKFPFIIHLLDDRECLRCKLTLPSAEFVVHCKGHAVM